MKWVAWTLAALVLWGAIYSQLVPFSDWVLASTHVDPNSHLGDAVSFFAYDTPKVLMLLTLVVFAMGVVRSFFSPEKTRALLAGKREGVGNILAATLGIVTPFCSCSAVPLFIGFVSAGVPLGVTFSFLISGPIWRRSSSLRATGSKRASTPYPKSSARSGRGSLPALPSAPSSTAMCRLACWPRSWAWWSVPAAVLIGIPMYSNAAGIIPVVEALLAKDAALGTVLAFMMSVIALSLPEMIILRKVLTIRLIAVFVGGVAIASWKSLPFYALFK